MRKMRKGKIFTFMAANQIFFFLFFCFSSFLTFFFISFFPVKGNAKNKKKIRKSMNGYVFLMNFLFCKEAKIRFIYILLGSRGKVEKGCNTIVKNL